MNIYCCCCKHVLGSIWNCQFASHITKSFVTLHFRQNHNIQLDLLGLTTGLLAMTGSQIQPEENLQAVKAVPKALSKNLVGEQCLTQDHMFTCQNSDLMTPQRLHSLTQELTLCCCVFCFCFFFAHLMCFVGPLTDQTCAPPNPQ